MNLAEAITVVANPGAVPLIVCARCGLLRVPRPGKRVCAPCCDELERQWSEATPTADWQVGS